MRRLVILFSCVFLMVAVAGQAEATSSRQRQPPTAPASVSVLALSGSSAKVTWSPPSNAGSSKILGYHITSTIVDQRRPVAILLAPADARSKTFSNLSAGTTYTIAVVAWNAAGPSPAATVRYAAPISTTSFVFARDAVKNEIVKVPTAGGTVTTVATGFGTHFINYAVDKTGNVYVADSDEKTVLKVSATGARTTLRTGLTGAGTIQLDSSGRVYVKDGSAVRRLASPGSPEKVVAQAPDGFTINVMFVDSAGNVAIVYGGLFDQSVATFPVTGTPPPARQLQFPGSRYLHITGDQLGNLYFDVYTNGASGFWNYSKLAPGATTQVAINTRFAYYAGAVGPGNEFYLLQTATWCAAPNVSAGVCTPDRTVPELLKFAADGSTSSVPIQGVTLGSNDRTTTVVTVGGPGYNSVAVGATGDTFFTQNTTGILRIPPAGGAAVVLATGPFTDPQLSQ